MFYLSALQRIAMARTCVVLDSLAANPPAFSPNDDSVGLLFSDTYGWGATVDHRDVPLELANRARISLSRGDYERLGSIATDLRTLLAGSPHKPEASTSTKAGEEDPVMKKARQGLKRLGELFGGGDLSGFEVLDRASRGKPTQPFLTAGEKVSQRSPLDVVLNSLPERIDGLDLSPLLEGIKQNDAGAKEYLKRHLSVLLERAGREGELFLFLLARLSLCLQVPGLLEGLREMPLHGDVLEQFETDLTALMSLQTLAACGNLKAEALLRRLGSKEGSTAEWMLADLPYHRLAARYVAGRNKSDLLTLAELAGTGHGVARHLLEMVTGGKG